MRRLAGSLKPSFLSPSRPNPPTEFDDSLASNQVRVTLEVLREYIGCRVNASAEADIGTSLSSLLPGLTMMMLTGVDTTRIDSSIRNEVRDSICGFRRCYNSTNYVRFSAAAAPLR